MLKKYINLLKFGSSPGSDSVSTEHSSHTSLVYHLCNIFTYCFRYGKVLTGGTRGLLVPILKKPSLDPSVPNKAQMGLRCGRHV